MDAEDRGEPHPHTLYGPLCTPGDKLCEAVMLPPLRVGDRLAILHAGAYGFTAARGGFLSFAPPAEKLVRETNPDTGELREALRECLPQARSELDHLGPDEPLPLDSMDIVNFMVALEDRFQVRFRPDRHDVVAIFSSLRSIHTFLAQEGAK